MPPPSAAEKEPVVLLPLTVLSVSVTAPEYVRMPPPSAQNPPYCCR